MPFNHRLKDSAHHIEATTARKGTKGAMSVPLVPFRRVRVGVPRGMGLMGVSVAVVAP